MQSQVDIILDDVALDVVALDGANARIAEAGRLLTDALRLLGVAHESVKTTRRGVRENVGRLRDLKPRVQGRRDAITVTVLGEKIA